MELSIFSYYPLFLYEKGFYSSIDEALSDTRKQGITSAELFTFELDKYPFDLYREYLNRNDIKLNTIIITTSFALHGDKNYASELDRIKRLTEDAQKAGAKFVMLVPDSESANFPQSKLQIRDNIIKGMNEITQYTKNSGIQITMENFSLASYPYSTIDEMKYILKNVSDLKFTIDSGNFYCVENDILKAYDELKAHVVNVHIKDWHEDPEGLISRPNLPVLDGCNFGTGLLPLKELLSRLTADKYNGSLVIELNSEKITPESIKLSAEFLRRNINA